MNYDQLESALASILSAELGEEYSVYSEHGMGEESEFPAVIVELSGVTDEDGFGDLLILTGQLSVRFLAYRGNTSAEDSALFEDSCSTIRMALRSIAEDFTNLANESNATIYHVSNPTEYPDFDENWHGKKFDLTVKFHPEI